MDIKISLPLLPLRDIVVFPSMVIPLFVGRDKSISALNEVMKKDKKIILVTQKNSEIDENFYKKNTKGIDKKIKDLQLTFKINFLNKSLPNEIFEFNHDLMNKVKNNAKELIEQNKSEDLTIEKSYRRKIKKKLVDIKT